MTIYITKTPSHLNNLSSQLSSFPQRLGGQRGEILSPRKPHHRWRSEMNSSERELDLPGQHQGGLICQFVGKYDSQSVPWYYCCKLVINTEQQNCQDDRSQLPRNKMMDTVDLLFLWKTCWKYYFFLPNIGTKKLFGAVGGVLQVEVAGAGENMAFIGLLISFMKSSTFWSQK